MKKIAVLISIFVMMGFVLVAQDVHKHKSDTSHHVNDDKHHHNATHTKIAHDVHRHKKDPSYHVNNYKHHNKAVHASTTHKHTAEIPISENVVVSKNYKQAGVKTTEKALEVVRTEPREVYLSRQNHKMPANITKTERKAIVMQTDSVTNQGN